MRLRPKVRREISRAVWEYRRHMIRLHRIRSAQVHRHGEAHTMSGKDPYHCVCNGTHVDFGWCPRCPQR
jgi:hypothetical protein